MAFTVTRSTLNVYCVLGNTKFTSMQLDLNLLTALDALLEEGSVSGAANRLHLSIPAMSRHSAVFGTSPKITPLFAPDAK